MHLGYTYNEYGTLVSKHKCDTCGDVFTLCPPVSPEEVETKGWQNCLATHCPSYNIKRDIDLFWDMVPIHVEEEK